MWRTIRSRYAQLGIADATLWLLGAPYRVAVKQTSNLVGLLRLPVSVVSLWLIRLMAVLRLPTLRHGLATARRSLVLQRVGEESSRRSINTSHGSLGLVMILAPIDWAFRVQRPQHLAIEFAKKGYDVVYVNPTVYYLPLHGVRAITQTIDDVQVVNLFSKSGKARGRYLGTSLVDDDLAESISQCLRRIATKYSAAERQVLMLQQPGWLPVALRLGEMRIVADWMDLHRGFTAIDGDVVSKEHAEWWFPDAVNCTAQLILEELQISQGQLTAIVPNGCNPEHWAGNDQSVDHPDNQPLTVGYFGAVADWFDVDPIIALHKEIPDIHIEVVGSITDPTARSTLESLERVRLLGEIPYQELPENVRSWSVGLIPFKINDLIRATNPVKLFEYASLGLPVVATPIPEVIRASESVAGVYFAEPGEFPITVRRAVLERGVTKTELRRFAAQNTWQERAGELETLFGDHNRVSVVVLMWNNSQLTVACLESLVYRSLYENLEVILVDNGSKPTESTLVTDWIRQNDKAEIVVVRNENNLGFAAGMNAGIRAATGDYVVLLNNDTQVTPGWVRKMIRHFRRNAHIGILGPLTDHCGNEAQVKLPFGDWTKTAPKLVQGRSPIARSAQSLGFFCVMISRETLNSVGLLSEEYGQGYFEDDDYCNRVREHGKICAIAQDVFIHHEMSASFDQVKTETRRSLFECNKAIYEAKWGTWVPHSYDRVGDEV